MRQHAAFDIKPASADARSASRVRCAGLRPPLTPPARRNPPARNPPTRNSIEANMTSKTKCQRIRMRGRDCHRISLCGGALCATAGLQRFAVGGCRRAYSRSLPSSRRSARPPARAERRLYEVQPTPVSIAANRATPMTASLPRELAVPTLSGRSRAGAAQPSSVIDGGRVILSGPTRRAREEASQAIRVARTPAFGLALDKKG